MSKIDAQRLSVPPEMLDGWQSTLNLLAEIVAVPSALIMRVHKNTIEVCCSNTNFPNPYKVGDRERLGQGLYCETVINEGMELLVSNATKDANWSQNPDIKLGMVSYCGLPLNWPTGEHFGTICILDEKENQFSLTYRQLLDRFRILLESQLTTLYQNEKLYVLNHELQNRVNNRTKDLASLNFSLNKEIDKRRAAEEQVHYQKHHDIGTGFLNRNALEKELAYHLNHAIEQREHIALVHIGFTNGRRLQSKYGYNEWDRILTHYSHRLSTSIKNLDIITARPTSTDLVLLVRANQLMGQVEALCHTLVEVSHSEFVIEQENVHLHAYIGIATSEDTNESAELLKFAAEAMLSCKDSGHKFSFYSQTFSESHSHMNQLESYLLQAVRSDDLLLYFQPKVAPVTHKWTGAEALLRWRHPILGDISNERLIHIAEQNGLIFEVGNFVLRSAIEKAAQWAQKVSDFKVAINISAIQLKNINFANQVQDLLEAYQLPAHYLELEVTESGLIGDELVAKNTLTALHNLGVTLSLDDFGTGYASFQYLKKYPFDCIKIDKSFIQQLDSSEEDRAIVRSIISVAKKLNLTVTTEGIETLSQEAFIIGEGCEFGQGYLYGRPMPCDEFELGLFNQNQSSDNQIALP
ncbi:bifunctional diguanylate cyclase/phosphodiesterase [Vibrio sp. ZSDE26]|uniref:Bifunctional diguanylate cyclase/phosphodiesterase n=1 Tax=Vibrio amylolyticus TaxID=2847292 RepID=A0A9X1XMX0_9VIBR|nr:EAL domain-containing protein [Vibrio amylolyticus]MCK6263890.1 bifunctional diguanylate cyclase/phosphodiesterase [Vibrio amylolyticus]